ncbi:hypothetical protein [uncultured Brevibacterium sp.]|nr:hypothetical protein [uncultured Brevibacterium sp.]
MDIIIVPMVGVRVRTASSYGGQRPHCPRTPHLPSGTRADDRKTL